MTQNAASSTVDLSQVSPSFVLNFFENHWTLSPSGSSTKPRTFSYTHIISSLLDDINACRIPVDYLDLFDAARIPFYDGCLVVEMQDNRPQGQRASGLASSATAPPVQRVILRPTAETLWADIRMLNERHGRKWSDQDALSLEARIVNVTAPPLCLDPDPLVNRITNLAVRAGSSNPSSVLKRKQSVVEDVEDEMAKSKRLKIMGMMNPRANRPSAATFNQLRFFSMRKGGPPAPALPENSVSPRPPLPAAATAPAPAPAAVPPVTATPSPVPGSALPKPKLKRKSEDDEDDGNAKNKRKVVAGKKPGRQSDYGDSPATPSFPLPAIAVTQPSNDPLTSRPPSTRPIAQHPQQPKKEEDAQQQPQPALQGQQPQPQPPQQPPTQQPQILPHSHPHQLQVPPTTLLQQQPMQNVPPNMNMAAAFPAQKANFLALQAANRKKALPQQPMQGQPQVPTAPMTQQQQQMLYQQYAAHAQAQAHAHAHAQAQAQAHQAQLQQAGLKMLPQAQQAAAQNRFNAPLMSRSPRPQAGMPQHPQIPPQYRQAQQHLPQGVAHVVPGQPAHNPHPAGVNGELPVGVGFPPGPYANFNFPLQLPAMGMGVGAYPQAGWRIPAAPAPAGARPQQVQGQMLPMGHPGQ